ncbi:MAG: hypothetical protein K2K73_00985, partial [Ureaplasma sp.]|nr:hypothetical protein [Ureaplasma sp.]
MNKKTIIIGAISTLLITGGVAGTAAVLINATKDNLTSNNGDIENKNIIFNKTNIQNLIKSIQQQINENKLTRTEFSKDNFKDIVINNLYSIDKKVGHLIEDVKLINSKQIQIFLNKKNDYQLDGIIAADNLAEYDKSTKIITLNISSLSFYELYDVSNLENLYQQLNDWIIDPTRLYTSAEFLNFVETNNELIKTIILQYLNFNIVNKISNNDLIRTVVFNQNTNQLEITLNNDYKKYNLTESNNIKIIDNIINVYNFTFYTSHTIINNKLNNLESEIQSYINSENNMFTINEFNQQINTNVLKSEIANFLGINVSAIGQITFNNNILKIYPITMNKFVTESNNIIEKVEVNNLRFYVSKSLFNLEELYNAINSYIINTNRKFSTKEFNNYLINSKIEAKQLIADNLYISETQTMDVSDINDLVFDETNKILKIVLNNNYIKYDLASTTNASVRNNVISVSNLQFYTPLITTDQNIQNLKQNIQNYINLVSNCFSLEEFNQQLNSINFKREIANYLSIDINGIGEILFSNGILKIKASNFFKFVSDSIIGSNNIIDGISIDGLQFYTIHELTNLENLYNVLNNYILEPSKKYTSVEFEDEVQQNNIAIKNLIADNLYIAQNQKIDPNDILDIKFNEMLKQLEITLANNYVKYNFTPTNHVTIENNKLIISGFTFYEKIMIDEIRLNNFKSNVQDYINELANQYTLNEFTSQINSSGFKNLIASSLGVALSTINEIKYENDSLTITPNNMKKFVSNSTSNILNDGELKVIGLQFYIQENLVKLDMLYKAVNDYILD